MIVTSGVFVFAAAALLIDGVFFTSGQSGTPWQIWASIVVSAAAALLLVAGALRERTRRPAPAEGALVTAPAPPTREELRIPAAAPIPAPAAPVAPAPTGFAGAPTDRVLVVAGRPRYHRAGCRYVADRGAQELTVDEARSAGYTACGVCRPDDDLLGGGTAATAVSPPVVPSPPQDERLDPPPPDTSAEQPSPPPQAPAEAVAPPAPVVLVRNRYHRPDCRYVAVAAERREVSRAEARDSGALPCGVCRP